MFSITLKRSAATLGVVAGLLAAAAPASAQILDGPLMWHRPTESISFNYLMAAGTETGNPERSRPDATSQRSRHLGLKAGSSEVLMETVTAKAPANAISGEEMTKAVKAPANAVTASFLAQPGLMRRDPDRSILTVEIGIAPLQGKERGEVLGVEPL